eukprot:CAMPEP_0178398258 /NCGR_PEP_ID=MMETSP0689_2-20121128/14679_1 /TAXON_ID=160604 /ORGANISM="Amphidinium massartii, Strain CS-259" /LENGTH=232 /DNA_ID=CAMNT_0020019013 /DNA_START=111 /DNA_END=809 /DNA_ORIENTATION=+
MVARGGFRAPCQKTLRDVLVLAALASACVWAGCFRTSPSTAAFVGNAHVSQQRARKARCLGLRAVGLIYGTQTGNTEEVAGLLADATGLEAVAVDELSAADLEGYDGLIVGCPTWNTGADEYRSGTTWDDLLDEIKGMKFSGKPVAVFGCGDSQSYGDNFCDGIEELHDVFAAAGAKTLGYVDENRYSFVESKSVRDGKFLGLPLDQDNEADMSEERIGDWVAQLKSEGMPL